MSWNVATLGQIAAIERDTVDPGACPEAVPYVGLEDIGVDGVVAPSGLDSRTLSSAKFRFTAEHILFGKLRPYLRKTARPDFDGVCSTDILPILSHSSVDRGFLYHYLRTDVVVARATSLSSGANLPRISPRLLLGFPVPLPPLEEQRRIAAVLDAAKTLIRKRSKSLDLAKSLPGHLLQEMFGPPELNRFDLPVVTFGSLILQGPTNGLYKPSTEYGEGTPILRISDFYEGRVTQLTALRRLRTSPKEVSAFGLSNGDIVINRVNSREYLGKSALVEGLTESTIFESNMMRVRLNGEQIDPKFAISFLQTPFVRRQVLNRCKDAVNQSSINQQDVRSIKIVLPPIDAQRRFAGAVAAVERLSSLQQTHLAELTALFSSLQHRAFTGDLTINTVERDLADAT